MIAWRAAAAWFALAACSSEHRKPPAPAAPIASPGPSMADHPEKPARPHFTGVITAGESASLAPRAPGVIKAVRVDAGDKVAAGDIIAEMDPAEMRDELRAAEAAAAAAGAALKSARVESEDAHRKLALELKAVADGISPAQNVEEQRMNVKRAEAAVDRARSTHAAELARAQTARDHFADTDLRAPFSGTVALRFHDAGNRVQAGEPILKLVGQGRMRLRFAVAPEDARTLVADSTVTATVDTIAVPLRGTVKQIAPAVDPATGMIIVDAELAPDGHATELRPGLAAWVTLQ